MELKIDNQKKLELHLNLMKKRLKKAGYSGYQLYPAFCFYYDQNKERYALSKGQVLEAACDILIEAPPEDYAVNCSRCHEYIGQSETDDRNAVCLLCYGNEGVS